MHGEDMLKRQCASRPRPREIGARLTARAAQRVSLMMLLVDDGPDLKSLILRGEIYLFETYC
jgi:hypothetical protein